MSEDNHLGGKVGLDVTDFKAGVNELGRQIRVIDSEFKASAASMEDWGDSTEGLEKRIESLNKINDLQVQKIDGLKEAYKKIVEEQGESSKAAQNMQIRINKETAALNKNQLELDQASEKLKDFGKSTEDAAEKTGKFKTALSKMGTGLKNIGSATAKTAVSAIKGVGAAAGAAVAGIVALTESTQEYRSDMAKFEQNVTSAGGSMDFMKDQLSEVTALTGESDSAIEALSNLMAADLSDSDMASAVDALSGAVIKFPDTLKIESLADGLQETLATGQATGTFAELIERMGGSLEDFDAAMESATTQAEKQQVALDWLANSGLSDVNEAYREANKEILSAAEAEFEMNDAMADLAKEAEPAIAILKTGVAEVVKDLVRTLTGASGASDDFASSIKTLASDAMAQVKNVLPLLSVALETVLPTLVESIAEIMPEITETAGSLLAIFAESLIGAVPSILPLLISLVLTIITMLAQLLIEQGPMLIETGMSSLMMLVEGIVQALPELVTMAVTLMLTFVSALTELLPDLIPVAIEAITILAMGLVDALPALIEMMPVIVTAIVTGLIGNLPLLVEAAVQIIAALVMALVNSAPELLEAAIVIIGQLLSGLITGITSLLTFVPTLYGKIRDELADMDWGQFGKDMIMGMGDGIANAASSLASNVKEAASNALSSAKSFLGIQSPSTVFRDEVGAQIGAGMAEGVSGSASQVSSALTEVNKELASGVSVGSGSSNGTGGNIYVEVPLTMDGKSITKSTSTVQYRSNKARSRALGVVPG